MDRLRKFASWVRHDSQLQRLEPLWRRVQHAWDALVGRLTRSKGVIVTVNGDRLRLNYAYGPRYEKQGYEPHIHEVFVRPIRENMVVFDVGAHVGFFTLAAALRVGANGRVVAFEPAPTTIGVLGRHVALNKLDDRVEIVPAVVGDAVGETTLYVQGDSMAASVSRTVE